MLIFQPRKSFHRRPAAADEVAPEPPPPPPPELAVVIAAAVVNDGANCTLTFDRPIGLVDGAPVDGSIRFDGRPPTGAAALAPDTLYFGCDQPVGPGSTWAIEAQPPWVSTPLASPAGGTF